MNLIHATIKSFDIVYRIEKKRIWLTIFDLVVKIIHSFIFGVIFFKYFLDVLFEEKDIQLAVILIFLQLIWHVFYYFHDQWHQNIYLKCSNARVKEKVYSGLFAKTIGIEMARIDSPEYYDDFRLVLRQSADAMLSITDTFFKYMKDMILLLLNGTLFLFYEPIYAIFIVLNVFCTYVTNLASNKYQVQKTGALNPVQRKYDYVKRTFYTESAAVDLKTSKVYDVILKSEDSANCEMQQVLDLYNTKLFRVEAVAELSRNVFGKLPYILLGIKAILTKLYTSSDIAVIVLSMGNTRNSLNSIISIYPELQKSGIYVEKYLEYMKSESKIPANKGGKQPKEGANAIRIRDVSFSYDGEKEVLSHINMDIRAGEKVAIVGENGAGKSTLVKLLLRLYIPREGEIELDEVPAQEYNLEAYRDRFGVAFQDTRLYCATVAENVWMDTCTEGESERVVQALKSSGIYSRVAEAARGIETTVTREFDPDGIEFSGGQAQKIALARVFARDSGIVILDEPSAALDPMSEAEMFDNMLRAAEKRTVVMISHRLSACRGADMIYVLSGGRIVEQGTHQELTAAGGMYANMWETQASGYIDLQIVGEKCT